MDFFINSDELNSDVVFPQPWVPEDEPLPLSQDPNLPGEARALSVYPLISYATTVSPYALLRSRDDIGMLSLGTPVA